MLVSGSARRSGDGLGRCGSPATKRAVAGCTCMSPIAPSAERESATKPLSASITAATSAGSRPLRAASSRRARSCSSGYHMRAYQPGISWCTWYQAAPAAARATRAAVSPARRRRRRRSLGAAGRRRAPASASRAGPARSLITDRRIAGTPSVLREAVRDPGPQGVEAAVVDEDTIGAGGLLVVPHLASAARVEVLAARLDPAPPQLGGRGEQQRGVEAILEPRLEQQRHLADQQRRRRPARGLLGRPGAAPARDPGVQQRLEEGDPP